MICFVSFGGGNKLHHYDVLGITLLFINHGAKILYIAIILSQLQQDSLFIV